MATKGSAMLALGGATLALGGAIVVLVHRTKSASLELELRRERAERASEKDALETEVTQLSANLIELSQLNEAAQQQSLSEKAALSQRVDGLMQALAREREQHQGSLKQQDDAMREEMCLHRQAKDTLQKMSDDKAALETAMASEREVCQGELIRMQQELTEEKEKRAAEKQRLLEEMASNIEAELEERNSLKREMATNMQAEIKKRKILETQLGAQMEDKVAAMREAETLRQELVRERQALSKERQERDEERTLAGDAQSMLSQSLEKSRKELERVKGDADKSEAEHERMADSLKKEREERKAEQSMMVVEKTKEREAAAAAEKTLASHHQKELSTKQAELDSALAEAAKASQECRRLEHEVDSAQKREQDLSNLRRDLEAKLTHTLNTICSGLKEARMQNTIRLEELLDQEKSEVTELRAQESQLTQLVVDLEAVRNQALAQVSEVQERNLRVIHGLMDDVAKSDVAIKLVKQDADKFEQDLAEVRTELAKAQTQRDALVAERDALVSERDEERDAKASALVDADHVSEELMYLHSETTRQAEEKTELEKNSSRVARERDYLQEMLTKSKKKQEADAKELQKLGLESQAWQRMACTRAPHTDAKHLQWFRQSLLAKKKEGTLDEVEEKALEAFETEAATIFSKTSATGQHFDTLLVDAFHKTLLQNMARDDGSTDENAPPRNQNCNKPVSKLPVKTLAHFQALAAKTPASSSLSFIDKPLSPLTQR